MENHLPTNYKSLITIDLQLFSFVELSIQIMNRIYIFTLVICSAKVKLVSHIGVERVPGMLAHPGFFQYIKNRRAQTAKYARQKGVRILNVAE